MGTFGHVSDGYWHGQGSHATSLLGVESVARKGGTGRLFEHAQPSKSAPVRRKPQPHAATTQEHVGLLSRDRRRQDAPVIIRQKSIEHVVRRRHSQPYLGLEIPDAGRVNLVTHMSAVRSSADILGRDAKTQPRPASPECLSNPAAQRYFRGRKARSCSPPGKQQHQQPSPLPQLVDLRRYEGELMSSHSHPEAESLVRVASGSCCSSDDGNSTGSTTASGLSAMSKCDGLSSEGTHNSVGLSPMWESLGAEISQNTAKNLIFAKTVDRGLAESFERRLQAKVKAQQKKALEKVA